MELNILCFNCKFLFSCGEFFRSNAKNTTFDHWKIEFCPNMICFGFVLGFSGAKSFFMSLENWELKKMLKENRFMCGLVFFVFPKAIWDAISPPNPSSNSGNV